jgi:hypothetical protein
VGLSGTSISQTTPILAHHSHQKRNKTSPSQDFSPWRSNSFPNCGVWTLPNFAAVSYTSRCKYANSWLAVRTRSLPTGPLLDSTTASPFKPSTSICERERNDQSCRKLLLVQNQDSHCIRSNLIGLRTCYTDYSKLQGNSMMVSHELTLENTPRPATSSATSLLDTAVIPTIAGRRRRC